MNNTNFLNFLQSLQKQDEDNHIDVQEYCNNQQLRSLYLLLTKNYSLFLAKNLSKEERTANQLTSNSLSYGEINYDALSRVFQHVDLAKGGIFYDLGSGIGKGVIAASFLHQFEICRGIEYLHSLHEQACKLKEEVELKKNLISQEMEIQGIYDYEYPKIEFINDDFRKLDWNDGTFFFSSTTCFDPDLMKALNTKAQELKQGTYFVTITKLLEPHKDWDLIKTIKVNLSWGLATILIQRKKMNQ